MRMDGRAGGFALALMGLSLVACGDDDKKHTPSDDSEETDGGTRHGDAGNLDASRGLDGARPDATTSGEDSGAQGSEDGAVSNASDAASSDDIDAAGPSTDDAATGSTTDAASDQDAASDDDSGGNDASSQDASAVVVDASSGDAGDAGDASVRCDINSPTYGCGEERGESWVVFANGVEVDRDNHVGWSPFYDYVSPSDAMNTCATLVLSGLNAWVVPDISDVRSMAAGCAQTVNIMAGSPVAQCQVQSADTSDGSNCTCNKAEGSGPHNGLFCRADVPECVTLWTRTGCGSGCGPVADPWFYDVTTGSVVLGSTKPELLGSAKFRCATYINQASLP